jgi:hypothetical protein
MARTFAPRSAILFIGVALLALGSAVLTPTDVARAAPQCAPDQVRQGTCDAQVGAESDGASVDLVGELEAAGEAPKLGGKSGPPTANLQDPACLRPQPNRPASCFTAAEPGDPGIPTITIRDIATFIPTPGRQQMEPDGWAVAGLDTNFYAITGPHVVNGTLLGRPADVRFTPTSFQWSYGDGTSATRNTKGGTWEALGIPEFEPTPTSHVYEQVGDYTITLSIVFAAEYRFDGGPWRPVVGTITLPANNLYIRVGTAKTVLVEDDCLANPSGPGC